MATKRVLEERLRKRNERLKELEKANQAFDELQKEISRQADEYRRGYIIATNSVQDQKETILALNTTIIGLKAQIQELHEEGVAKDTAIREKDEAIIAFSTEVDELTEEIAGMVKGHQQLWADFEAVKRGARVLYRKVRTNFVWIVAGAATSSILTSIWWTWEMLSR